jgi:plastocyanin
MHNVKLVAALAVVLAACGGGGGDGGTQPPPPAVFTSLTVSPANPDLVFRDTLQMTATPRDQNGAAMTGLGAATFERLSGTAVSVTTAGRLIADQTGSAQIRASLTSGTTTRTATATATVSGLSASPTVTASGAGTSFSPDTVKVAVGSSVTWNFPGPETHNVTFDGTPPAGGNIADRSSGSEGRTFASAGRFTYRCTRHAGMNGAVVVRTP